MSDASTNASGAHGVGRALAAWLAQGARSAVFLRPDWSGLRATPWGLAGLLLLDYLVAIAIGRLEVPGEARFWWPALLSNWLGEALCVWLAWFMLRAAPADARPRPADAATVFTLLAAQSLVLGAAISLLLLPVSRSGDEFVPQSHALRWVLWLAPLGWLAVAQIAVYWRVGIRRAGPRLVAATLVVGSWAAQTWLLPVRFWYPLPAHEAAEDAPPTLMLTQELMEAQPKLLAASLEGLAPQRRGVVDLYAITFAPYASQGVFRRESAMVADVMAQRFDAGGRVVQLVNSNLTAGELPWATPLNLQRAIAAVARRMDRAEDVLFIHLTSHGGSDGRLAMDFDPLALAPVTPGELKQWLDDAGVRWRVISISACYSGSWIAPLAGDGTLVMTAADADHTSYGCGSRSPLTFFGQAMYDEQLRHDTRSFEQAFARSRKLIDERERAAGKTDGYSNPQISEGAAIRGQLVKLEARLAAREVLAASAAPSTRAP